MADVGGCRIGRNLRYKISMYASLYLGVLDWSSFGIVLRRNRGGIGLKMLIGVGTQLFVKIGVYH